MPRATRARKSLAESSGIVAPGLGISLVREMSVSGAVLARPSPAAKIPFPAAEVEASASATAAGITARSIDGWTRVGASFTANARISPSIAAQMLAPSDQPALNAKSWNRRERPN